MSILRNDKLDEAAHATLTNLGWGVLLGLAPLVVTRRARVLVLAQVFSAGVAGGLSWRDCQRILHGSHAVPVAQLASAVQDTRDSAKD